MLRAKSLVITLISAFACAACGQMDKTDDPSSERTAEESPAMRVVDLGLAGTFMSDSRQVGELAQLVMKTDGSFHSATLVKCEAARCAPVQEDGLYRISWRDSRKYITLLNASGVVHQYQYEWRDNTLRLLQVDHSAQASAEAPKIGRWLTMRLDTTAWCAASSDCNLQNLPIGPCSGEWSCGVNVCNWSCGAISAR